MADKEFLMQSGYGDYTIDTNTCATCVHFRQSSIGPGGYCGIHIADAKSTRDNIKHLFVDEFGLCGKWEKVGSCSPIYLLPVL